MTIVEQYSVPQIQSLTLTDAEIEHFALQGYVVKRQVLDPEVMEKAVDLMWGKMPDQFDRRDPSSWRGNVTDCQGTLSIDLRYGRVKLRSEIWDEAAINELIIQNEAIFRMVEQLLGRGNVERPDRVRGLYPIFPMPERMKVPLRSHVDMPLLPFKVSLGAYLQEVPPHGGGLTVWPGSHRTLFYDLEYSTAPGHLRTKQFRKHEAQLYATEPVEITGDAGDIVLFHHCLMHAPGINTIPGHVRQAVYCNFRTKECEFGALIPRPANMWEGWDGILALDSPRVRETFHAPADPLLGRKAHRGRLVQLYVEKVRRRVRKAFGY